MNRRLKERRKALGLTQREVAKKIGMAYQQYQKYEDKGQIPNAVTACKIAVALETTVESLWGDYHQE